MRRIILIAGVFAMAVLLVALTLAFLRCVVLPRHIPLDSAVWSDWDVGAYDERRYNMALWLFDTNWFEGKTSADVLAGLPNHRETEIQNSEIRYDLRYSNEFMERWDIDYRPIPIAALHIYFDGDGDIVRAVLEERNDAHSEFTVTKTWAGSGGVSGSGSIT